MNKLYNDGNQQNNGKSFAVFMVVLLAIFGMQFYSTKKMKDQQAQQPKQEQQVQKTKQVTSVAPQKSTTYKINTISRVKKEKKIELNNEYYQMVFTNKDAAIESCIYKKSEQKQIETVAGNEKLHAAKGFNFPLDFTNQELLKEADTTLWSAKKLSDKKVLFSTNKTVNGQRLQIQKTYTLAKDNRYFDVNYKIINLSGREFVFPENAVILSSGEYLGPQAKKENRYNTMTNFYGTSDDFKKLKKSRKESIVEKSGDIRYAGTMSRYLSMIMIPQNVKATSVVVDSRKTDGYRAGIKLPAASIPRRSSTEFKTKVYLGEIIEEQMIAVDPILKDADDTNIALKPIKKFVIWCLMGISNWVGHNIGWALIVFSIFTKIVFFPLTRRSTKSMQRMSAIGPEVKKLQEKYKSSPEVLNKKTMELYKKNKVNPMGGCLPLLIQMPFFIALFSALNTSLDLWHAPFIWWMKDLSGPDTITTIKGFAINILPILWAVAMFFQQKVSMSTTKDDNSQMAQQQKMMQFMPLIMLFFFWNMPSGLILYWLVQNVLQITEQLLTNKFSKDKIVK